MSDTPRTGDWWCPECKESLPWNRVTFTERCDTCGTPVHVAGEGEVARLERELTALREQLAGAQVDRSEAVNLASNIISRFDTGSYSASVTDRGVKALADAVIRMDAARRDAQ